MDFFLAKSHKNILVLLPHMIFLDEIEDMHDYGVCTDAMEIALDAGLMLKMYMQMKIMHIDVENDTS